MGEPKAKLTQSEVNSARERREAALSVLAGQLADDEVDALESEARTRIPAGQFPENFDDFRAEWLAEWVARGWLQMPPRKAASNP
ncbi:hypothetical protein COU75_02525 [Candidatus Peregrinibacteria bacterium CG10_big_fil_rev_8_21_14_0_10_42_8]|nr:MAG: hypothetical protein COU75_02525 [Candidatus Peregrinibacteria bacterium CG10_big_fil_rev_8_21_14_0_10_42_8]